MKHAIVNSLKDAHLQLSAQCIWEWVDDEVVVMSFSTGTFYALNPTASLMLLGILNGEDVEHLWEAVKQHFDIQADAYAQWLVSYHDFVTQLCEEGILAIQQPA